MLTWDHVLVDLDRALQVSHPENADAILRRVEVALRTPRQADHKRVTVRHAGPVFDEELVRSIEASLRDCFPDRAGFLVRKVRQALGDAPAAETPSPFHGRELIPDDAWLALCPALTVIRPRGEDVIRYVSSRRFLLENQQTVVGRSSQSDIVILEEGVSRAHFEVLVDAGEATICDLRSRNGTHVLRRGGDGWRTPGRIPPLTDVPLLHGDCIGVGALVLYFSNPSQEG